MKNGVRPKGPHTGRRVLGLAEGEGMFTWRVGWRRAGGGQKTTSDLVSSAQEPSLSSLHPGTHILGDGLWVIHSSVSSQTFIQY